MNLVVVLVLSSLPVHFSHGKERLREMFEEYYLQVQFDSCNKLTCCSLDMTACNPGCSIQFM